MFEVGKKYTNPHGSVYDCIGANGSFGWLKNKKCNPATYIYDVKYWKEYVEPPPEDWRVIFKGGFSGLLHISTTSYRSEQEAIDNWDDHFFIKAIRVDK